MSIRFGFCTGFAHSMTGPVSYPLLEDIARAGFDFAEFPLMQTAALSEPDFQQLAGRLSRLGLGADCTCNMFPPSLRLLGSEARPDRIRAYLQGAFERLARLGTKKIVLGSSGARNLPQGMAPGEGYAALNRLLQELVIPLLEQFDMVVAIEPINRDEANFIRTLPQGMELVRMADHPRIRLLADTIHMLREEEPPQELLRFRPWLEHFHVSELDRALPAADCSLRLDALLNALREAGPTDTVSFETGPYPCAEMAAALSALRTRLEATRPL